MHDYEIFISMLLFFFSRNLQTFRLSTRLVPMMMKDCFDETFQPHSKKNERNTWKVFNCAEIFSNNILLILANHLAMLSFGWIEIHGTDRTKWVKRKKEKPIKYQNNLVINDVWIGAHSGDELSLEEFFFWGVSMHISTFCID